MSNLLTVKEVCEMFKVDRSTIWKWRTEGMPHKIVGKNSVRFIEGEVMAWVDSPSKGGGNNER